MINDHAVMSLNPKFHKQLVSYIVQETREASDEIEKKRTTWKRNNKKLKSSIALTHSSPPCPYNGACKTHECKDRRGHRL